MATVERIQQLLDCASRIQERDDAGVITPNGIDAQVRMKALRDCLRIAEEERRCELSIPTE